MTQSELDNQLALIFTTVFPDAAVPPHAMARDQTPGWESLGHLNLVLALEQTFGLELSDAEVLAMATYATVQAALTARLVS